MRRLADKLATATSLPSPPSRNATDSGEATWMNAVSVPSAA
jgi:hypothetical protein